MSLQALARSVSERGADALLKAALRERDLSPEDVTAAQMQLVLTGPLVHRLSTILSPEQARSELGALAARLEHEFPRTPTLFTDVGSFSPWDEGSAVNESSAVSDWDHAGDLRGAAGGSSDGRKNGQPSGASPLGASSLGASSFGARPLGASPVRASPVRADTPEGDDFEGDEFGADDFEFDDPEYAAAPSTRHYALSGEAGQDALIRDLGRMQGVLGVMVTRENGEVLRVGALRDVTQLGSVIAATGLLLRQRGLKLLAADLGQQTVCMRPLGNYSVAVIAGPQVNVGRLLTELQQLEASG
ncbi:roadblock/LC7 domain-containing protein [Deinococcus wulumuqiensis]|uniref:roadblock/LC7 domain-containing protein n=1 Tax=Deinococcus wulumuqiensis TaxID=980427 RepID=UPI001F075C03|nr:roadblock/LC7 domain-containing protein [Deinococcus wulumuqiensis]